jgi:MFS transporter, YNFM family, putative membrane transport protein
MYIKQGTRSFRKANLALFAGGFNTFAILYCLQPLMPEFTNDFGVSPAMASLSLSVTTIAMAIAMLIVGALSDAQGRKSVMALSLLGASIMAVLVALSPGFHMLLVFRIVQGIVLAGLPAIAMAYLSEEVEPASLGFAMGLYISGNSIGGMGGRIITGMLTDLFNWRIAVAAIALLSIAATALFWIWLPVSKNFKRRPFEIGRLIKALFSQCKDPRLLSLYTLGFLLMGSFVSLFNYISYELIAPPYNLSKTLVGWIFIVYIMGTISSTWMGRLSDKYGRQKVMVIALCIILTGTVLTLAASLWIKIIGLSIFTFGFFGGHSIASSWVGRIANQNKAQASSMYLFFYYMGSSVSGTVGGMFYSSFGWSGVVGMIVCYIAVALVLSSGLRYPSGKEHAIM